MKNKTHSSDFKKFEPIPKNTTDLNFFLTPPTSPFVEIEYYSKSNRERIIWPAKNFPLLIPKIAISLSELTRHAFRGLELGVEFIQSQLEQTKFLDIYRDLTTGAISQFARLDVYNSVPGAPISMGIFKHPKFSCESSNPLGELAFRELSDRASSTNDNPSVIHINCAFSPRGYEIAKNISDWVVPDVNFIYESLKAGVFDAYKFQFKDVNFSMEDFQFNSIKQEEKISNKSEIHQFIREAYKKITESIVKQTSEGIEKTPHIQEVVEFYLEKMRHITKLKLPFDSERSTVEGCIPVPKETIPTLNARDQRITDFFHSILDFDNGDMFVFYNGISLKGIQNKLNY
ncbi:MAG: hypothetical protein P0S96_02590 [Simkaniaceae bacterium]|nr:hypothetical protein [Candidatus Sacchlamyda saccharinae]